MDRPRDGMTSSVNPNIKTDSVQLELKGDKRLKKGEMTMAELHHFEK
jgi:hypothetical protein